MRLMSTMVCSHADFPLLTLQVVSRVWSELCTMLCATYAQAKPSEQQVALLSRDIDVVLATSFNVLLFACEDVQHVLGALDEGGDPRKVRADI